MTSSIRSLTRRWQEQIQQHQRTSLHELTNDENRNEVITNGYSNVIDDDPMTRSYHCQRDGDLNQFSRDFDMSQSLIVSKTTTHTEFLQLEHQFGSNSQNSLPPICHRRGGSYDSQSSQLVNLLEICH